MKTPRLMENMEPENITCINDPPFIAEGTKVRKTYYTLTEILTILKNIIRSEGMFDKKSFEDNLLARVEESFKYEGISYCRNSRLCITADNRSRGSNPEYQ